MDRPYTDCAGLDAERRKRGLSTLAELLGSALVEGDRADGGGVRAAVDEPGDPGDQGGGLAGTGGRHAEDGSWSRRGSGPLVRGSVVPGLPGGPGTPAGRSTVKP